MKCRIVSCNARLQCKSDAEQQFINRADFLAQTLSELDADVIGFQEITPEMKRMLAERLPGYAMIGGGRDKNRLGESPLIAVKQSKFFIERVETVMLSPQPTVPGSRYEDSDQSACPRAFASADITSLDGGEVFRLMNVHTDHIGKNARVREVSQMLEYYKAENLVRPIPTVITGDFNAYPDSPEITLMKEGGIFTDVTAAIPNSFHGYGRCDPPIKIDYIFTSPEFSAVEVFSTRKMKDGLYLSDHDPIIADLEF